MTPRRAEAITAAGGRERLLEAAMRLFASKGYAATSVRDIMSAAGVTAPSLYHHFGNKEGLFLAVFHATRTRIAVAEEEALVVGGSAAARILRVGLTHIGLRRELAGFAWAVLQYVSGRSRAASRFDFRALTLERIRSFERLVEEGVASGEFRPCTPRHVAVALAGAVDIASRPNQFDSDSGGSEEVLGGAVGVILSGITASRARTVPRLGATRQPVRKRNRSGN